MAYIKITTQTPRGQELLNNISDTLKACNGVEQIYAVMVQIVGFPADFSKMSEYGIDPAQGEALYNTIAAAKAGLADDAAITTYLTTIGL